ncbi:MAG: aminomethyl transferase family protein [Deltaproteobacteria bacterium]|nr:aminomethyl transferase family protein [Deltaproteobacteria bacterium]
MTIPLSSWHRAHGATFINDRGIEMPEHFSDPLQEYQAVRDKAGLIDLSFRALVRMTGEDRVSFLQGMISNDVKVLKPGEGCAATLLTEQGRIVADLRVYALENALLLDVDTRMKEKMSEALSRFIIADDVELEDLSEQLVTFSLQGPMAAQVLSAAGVSLALDKSYQHLEATLAGTTVRVIRASETGEDGYELLVPVEQAEHCWTALLKAGEPCGLQPVGLAALHMLRVEAGIPWYGLDMDEGRIVLEVGLANAISFKKGCYLGQEVVERASARGHVNRKLSGLLLHGDLLPTNGTKLFHDAQEVGWVTSAVHSPRFGHPIALGYVRREHLTPGTQLRIDSPGTPMIAEVTTLPFSR